MRGKIDWRRVDRDCRRGVAGLCEENYIEDDGSHGLEPTVRREGFDGEGRNS